MKTIADLNGKWWYRLVKVIYIFLLFSWSIGTAIGVYFMLEPEFDNENSYITCENGENYKLEENGLYLYSTYIGTYDKQKIQSLCKAPKEMTRAEYEEKYGEPAPSFVDKIRPVSFTPDTPEDNEGLTQEQLLEMGAKPVDLEKYRLPRYELVSVYTERNWFATIGYMLLAVLGWLIFFEIVRRVFYYVVLGSLTPKKNA